MDDGFEEVEDHLLEPVDRCEVYLSGAQRHLVEAVGCMAGDSPSGVSLFTCGKAQLQSAKAQWKLIGAQDRSSKGTTRTILKAQLAKVEGDYDNFEKRHRVVLDAARRAAGPSSPQVAKVPSASSSTAATAATPETSGDAEAAQALVFKEKGAVSHPLEHQVMLAEDTAKEMDRIAKDLAELHDMVSVVQDQLHAQAPLVDNVEQQVEASQEHTRRGFARLAEASKIHAKKAVALGAAAGFLVAGPLGAYAFGSALAGLGFALGGGVIGHQVGTVAAEAKQAKIDTLQKDTEPH